VSTIGYANNMKNRITISVINTFPKQGQVIKKTEGLTLPAALWVHKLLK
jgi:hypothetical protein